MKLGLLGLVAASLALGQAPPTIIGVSNTASGVARVTRGSLASIYGLNLSASTAQAPSLPLPTVLAGVSVTVGGIAAPLVYISPGQINVQIPFEVSSASMLDVVVTRDGATSGIFSVPRDEYAPGIFLYPRAPGVFDPIIVHSATNQLVTPTNPAVANEVLVVYATGVGALNNAPRSGAASPDSKPATAVDPVTATLGGNPVNVLFAGLTPGLVGLIQFNIQLGGQLGAQLGGQPGTQATGAPLTASSADSSCLPLIVRVGGSATPSVNLPTGPGGCSPAVGSPAIAASPAKLDFGSVAPGQMASMIVTVQNTGNATLTVKAVSSNNAHFSITSPSVPFQVVAGGLAAVTVQFAPDAAGPFSGSLTIQSNDPAHPAVSVDLAGTGTAPPAPALSLSAPSLDFGSLGVGQSKGLSLNLRNTGTATLNVVSVNTDSQRFSPAAPPFFPAQILAGQQVTVMVVFSPLLALPYNATITITSNDPAGAVVTVPVKGMGIGGTPAITVDPATVDFPGVVVGQTQDMPVTIRNSGTAALVINEVLSGSTGQFLITAPRGPITIPPAGQTVWTVRFAPTAAGQISDVFYIDWNNPVPGFKNVKLTGVGIAPP